MKSHYQSSKIINKNEFELLGDNIICSICQEILYQPVQCDQCQNCFCKECILQWLTKSQTCPFKCESFKYKENKFVNKILSIIKFKCDNNCGNEIPYLELDKHYEQNCPKINFKEKYISLLKEYKEITNLKFSLNHCHILNFTFYNANSFTCDLCRINLKEKYGLACRSCNFDICKSCNQKIKEKKLHEHPLELSKNTSDFECMLCKEKNNGKKNIFCSKCKKYICFKCAIK